MKSTKHFCYSAIVLGVCFSIPGIAAPPDKNAPSEVIVINDGTIPIPVTANAYRFVGFSTDTVFGDAGIAAMHQNCQFTYGAAARMCTTKEVFETTDIPADTGQRGWVQPVIMPYRDSLMDSVSGISSIVGVNCTGWSSRSGSSRGFTVDGAFIFGTLTCDTENYIACCAP